MTRSGVPPTFSRRTDGVVDIDLGPDCQEFTNALLDAVSSRAPRGSADANPSTYWIDRALADAQRPYVPGDTRPIASGNAYEFHRRESAVVAYCEYAPEWEQVMPLEDYLAVLQAWRDEVLRQRRQDK